MYLIIKDFEAQRITFFFKERTHAKLGDIEGIFA